MNQLLWASLFFLALHLVVAGTSLRTRLVAQMGEGPYRGVFSVASLGGLIALALAYSKAFSGPDNRFLWSLPPQVMYLLGPVVMFAAVFLVVEGLSTPSPTAVGMEDRVDDAQTVKGILRITRHPFLWGVFLWASLHLVMNGDLASFVFFSTFVVLALTGPRSIDRKRARDYGTRWAKFCENTSNVPFLAIAQKRNHFVGREFLDGRLGVVILVFVSFLLGHQWLFGVSAY